MKEILLAPLFFLLGEKVSPVVLWNFRSSHGDGVASVLHLPTALLQGPELLSNFPRCFLKRELSEVTALTRVGETCFGSWPKPSAIVWRISNRVKQT